VTHAHPAPVPLSPEQRERLLGWLDDGLTWMTAAKRAEFLALLPPAVGALAGFHALGVQDYPGTQGEEIVRLTADWMRRKRGS